ncbi:MAG: hypothetical protein ABIR92_00345 [Gemmatimonadaceae bacterium]
MQHRNDLISSLLSVGIGPSLELGVSRQKELGQKVAFVLSGSAFEVSRLDCLIQISEIADDHPGVEAQIATRQKHILGTQGSPDLIDRLGKRMSSILGYGVRPQERYGTVPSDATIPGSGADRQQSEKTPLGRPPGNRLPISGDIHAAKRMEYKHLPRLTIG